MENQVLVEKTSLPELRAMITETVEQFLRPVIVEKKDYQRTHTTGSGKDAQCIIANASFLDKRGHRQGYSCRIAGSLPAGRHRGGACGYRYF